MLDTVKINHVQHISFTQSRLTDAVSVILSELLSYEHPSKERGFFACYRIPHNRSRVPLQTYVLLSCEPVTLTVAAFPSGLSTRCTPPEGSSAAKVPPASCRPAMAASILSQLSLNSSTRMRSVPARRKSPVDPHHDPRTEETGRKQWRKAYLRVMEFIGKSV